MSWIRQNSFLAGFFAVTAVLAIALGILDYLAYDKYSTVSEEFGKQATELKRLQSLVPYPSEENLKKVKAQRESLDAKVQTLQQSLTKMAVPVEPATPAQFQDKLRTTVLAISELAKQKDVKLPEKGFYLGFDGYQTTPPKPEAAFALANQLAGIELVVRKLLETPVAEIKSVKRAALVEEEAKSPGLAKQTAVAPVNKTSFEVEFKADQSRARALLDSVVGSKDQFYIIRSLHVENEKLKAPSKAGADDAKAGAATVASADPSKPADAAPQAKFILGTEKVDVIAQIEIVKFKGSTGK